MKCLIDANILLDVLAAREPFLKNSSTVWRMCETGLAEGYVSALTFADLVYILRKQLTPDQVEEILKKLGLIFTFTDLTPSDLYKAAGLAWTDFEDALQSVTAHRIGAEYIVTRNTKDYSGSVVPACVPLEFINKVMIGRGGHHEPYITGT